MTNHTYQSNDGAVYRYQNWDDEDGNPAGGFFVGPGIGIFFQDGTIKHGIQSGAQVVDVICAAIERVNFFQDGPFSCAENAEMLAHLHAAAEAGTRRHKRRVAAGLKGRHAEDEAA